VIVNIVASGLALGAAYALVAVGLALILGTMEILNMAHGAIAMTGAYVSYAVSRQWTNAESWSGYVLAVVLAVIAGAGIGVVLDTVIFRRLTVDPVAIIVATLAVASVFDGVVATKYGTEALSYDTAVTHGFRVAGTQVAWAAVLNVIVAVILLASLAVFIARTRVGLMIRASAQDPAGARLTGINTSAVRLGVTVIACALAALAGTLIATNLRAVVPSIGTTYVVPALVAVVVAGTGSVFGAAVVSFALGIIPAVLAANGKAGLTDIVVFGCLFVFMVIRPQGLFGGSDQRISERV
jgi:branched-chain amino acid transport system permease protein